MAKDRESWRAAVHGVTKSQHNCAIEQQQHRDFYLGFPAGSVVKNPPANIGDLGSIHGSERTPKGGNGNPLQYS